jgi:hypothetical protein
MRRVQAINFLGAAALALSALYIAAPRVSACSIALIPPFEVDPNLRLIDSMPPTPFTDIAAMTLRVASTHCEGDTCSASSCGDLGALELTFMAPRDDQTPTTQLGYRVVSLGGTMPESMRTVIAKVQPLWIEGRLSIELGFDQVTQLNGDLALIAVDRAGNESAQSEPVHVEFSGCTRYYDQPGCQGAPTCAVVRAVGSASSDSRLWYLQPMAAGILFACAWRRRRRAW